LNILFASDLHIIESELTEINTIFDELLIIKDKYCVNKLILAGDSFDKVNPTSKELDCLSTFLKKINLSTIVLAANSHESTSQTESVVNHFGILKDNIKVVKEYIDDNKLYVGHFIVSQSSKNFGATVDATTLKQYRYVILGHGHTHEMSNSNWCQLGSIRYVDFGEDPKIAKMIAVCSDYEAPKPKWKFIALNSPYPMINLELQKNVILEGSNDVSEQEKVVPRAPDKSKSSIFDSISSISAFLDQLDPKTKVRIVFKDYNLWRSFLPISETYKTKFFKFVEKKDFIIANIQNVTKENKSLKDSLIKFLDTNKIEESIKKILLEEIDE
jgi:DNA repair exonuclease SbcCD nuclease subunit